jgi:ketosteroid isomerase-like protein
MGMQKRKSLFGIIIAAIACVSIASAPSKALAGMIPYSFVGPHEYDYPGIAEKENAKLYSQVTELLEQHDKAFSAQDLKGVMKTYLAGRAILLMGNGPNEVYHGAEAVEGAYRQLFVGFEKGSLVFNYDRLFVGSTGRMAWFAAAGTIRHKVNDEVRGTGFSVSGALLKQKGAWRFIYMQFSRLGHVSTILMPNEK